MRKEGSKHLHCAGLPLGNEGLQAGMEGGVLPPQPVSVHRLCLSRVLALRLQ